MEVFFSTTVVPRVYQIFKIFRLEGLNTSAEIGTIFLAFPSLIVFKAFKSVGEDSPLFRKIDFC
jgi:hypothetical protein